jgi:hypothetical protein
MDEKPKRKRGESSHEIDFVTALTVEECVERLERGPARTLDYRLSVRTDGARFKVEVLGNTGNTRAPMAVLAEVDGYIQPWKTSHLRPGITVTRVTAHSETKSRLISNYWALVPIPISVFYAYILDTELASLVVPVLGVFITTVLLVSMTRTADKFNRQIPDLRQWLMWQLYEPPGPPEE